MTPQVLIVDDDAGVLFLHELMVLESGLSDNIKTFSRAEPALSYLNSSSDQQPFLVFLDINMPGMNGWDFMDRISNENSYQHVSVIIVTSSVNRSDKIKSETYSRIIGFVEKPLSLDVCDRLKKTISVHLEEDD